MAKGPVPVTWAHVVSTLGYIQDLTEALTVVVRKLGGVSGKPKALPKALYNEDGMRKSCPETGNGELHRRGKCPQLIEAPQCLSAQKNVRPRAAGMKRPAAKVR